MSRCYLEGHDGPCEWRPDGQPDPAHLIAKQRMRVRNLPDEVVWDPRVLIPLCRRHHHRLDHGFIKLRREQLPAEVEEFAREFDLVWSLDRDFGKVAA